MKGGVLRNWNAVAAGGGGRHCCAQVDRVFKRKGTFGGVRIINVIKASLAPLFTEYILVYITSALLGPEGSRGGGDGGTEMEFDVCERRQEASSL